MPRIDIFSKSALLAGLTLAVAVFTATTSAQATGGVKGRLRNVSGGTISGATITARQESKDVKTVSTDSKGQFQLTGLTPGTYNIVFDAKGYSSGVKYGIEVKNGKVIDLGDRLTMQVDQGTQVIVHGSVFFKDGTSVTAAKVVVERIAPSGNVEKIGTLTTNIYGEFSFRRPEEAAKYRITAYYRDAKASKEITVDSAAVYRLAISLDVSRQENQD